MLTIENLFIKVNSYISGHLGTHSVEIDPASIVKLIPKKNGCLIVSKGDVTDVSESPEKVKLLMLENFNSRRIGGSFIRMPDSSDADGTFGPAPKPTTEGATMEDQIAEASGKEQAEEMALENNAGEGSTDAPKAPQPYSNKGTSKAHSANTSKSKKR